MKRNTGRGDDFSGNGDPFGGFGSFGRPGSVFSSVFGGRNPFDDPFFNQPLGSMLGPSMFGPSMFGHSMFDRSMFGSGPGLFGQAQNSGFLDNQGAHQPPQSNNSRGPIITELNSDDEEEGKTDSDPEKNNENPRKHSRHGKEPYEQHPDEETGEKRSKHVKYPANYKVAAPAQPQSRSYSFCSSSVTYGGPGGAYYTASTTRRTGGNGVTIEESKEADTTIGKATHRMSRGLRDKGHSVTRKLNPDGKVDTLQTLHNLNEEELHGFTEEWKGNARQHLPGYNPDLDMLEGHSRRGNDRSRQTSNLALPSSEHLPQGSSYRPRRRV